MSTREQIVQMLDQVPDYCLVNEKDPDRGQYMPEAELCKELGITL